MVTEQGMAAGVTHHRGGHIWRAEVWRVWRSWRWLAFVAFVVMLAGIVTTALTFTGAGTTAKTVVQEVLFPQLYSISLQNTSATVLPPLHVTGDPTVKTNSVFVSLAFASALVAFDRGRAATLFAMTGPVARWRVWTVLGAFALAVPLAATTVKAAILLTLDASTGWAIPAHVPLAWWGINLLIDAAVAATALCVAAGVGQGFITFLASAFVCGAPAIVGEVVRGIGGMLVSGGTTAVGSTASQPWLVHIGDILVQLSPFSAHVGAMQSVGWGSQTVQVPVDTGVHMSGGVAVWLLLWTAGLLWLSWVVFRTSQVERWPNLFIVPTWAVAALWGVTGFFAFLAAQAAGFYLGTNYALVFFVSWTILGGTAHLIYRRLPLG